MSPKAQAKKRVCYICGTGVDVGPHHKIPREDGGLPLKDNIVWLCEPHHNEFEVYPWQEANKRLCDARADWRDAKRPQPKARLDYREDCPPIPTEPRERLEYLRRLRQSKGYLEANDAKCYHFLLAKYGRMRALEIVCLWCYQDFHAEALACRARGGKGLSQELAAIVAKVPKIIDSYLNSLSIVESSTYAVAD
jgi:hypothetical protein